MKISVVIPAFDVEPWVASAIESVLRQHPTPDEVVVVDDGSTDATAQIVRRYSDVVLLQQENRGVAAARNTGAGAASGDAFLFLDADNALLPGTFSALARTASRIGEWGALIPNYVPMGNGKPSPGWARQPEERVLTRREAFRLIRRSRFSGNALVHREAWRRHPFQEDLRACEDLDFWLRLLLAGERLVVLGRPLVRWRAGRVGGLTGDRVVMRETRRLVFERLCVRDDLTRLERLLVAYQLVRVSLGEAAARRAAGELPGSARSGLLQSPSSLVRASSLALAAPGLLSALAFLESLRQRR